MSKAIVCHGHAVAGSGGAVIGVVQKLDEQHQIIPEYRVTNIDMEIQRFQGAIKQASVEIAAEMKRLENHKHAEDLLPILQTHQLMLTDPELRRGTQELIQQEHINVEWALKRCLGKFLKAFEHMDDVYLKSRQADIEQVGKRLLSSLLDKAVTEVKTQSIIIATDFSPADVVSMWRSGITGFVAVQGGKDSHAMIVARGVGLSGLVGAQGLFEIAEDGDELILDAEHNTWTLRPSQHERLEFEHLQQSLLAEHDALQAYATAPSQSKDGYKLPLLANVEFIEEVAIAQEYGADGIGLFRTEFLFMQADVLPTEDEQVIYYQAIVRGMKGKPVTFRLLDVGADKLAHVQTLFGDYDGENPALGLRGVRMLLHKPEILKTQLRAILLCAVDADVSILVPMVISVAEMEAVREVLQDLKNEMGIQKEIPLGCMIEVPAAALIADDLAEVSDFFSVGSNDLVQYGLAVDRSDEHVGHLYDADHQAIKAMIQMAVTAASIHDIPVTICGELASNITWTQAFLDMRVSSLSMTSRHILSVRKHLKELSIQT